jgi:hypothetical protein
MLNLIILNIVGIKFVETIVHLKQFNQNSDDSLDNKIFADIFSLSSCYD